jgi:hypothetical protein
MVVVLHPGVLYPGLVLEMKIVDLDFRGVEEALGHSLDLLFQVMDLHGVLFEIFEGGVMSLRALFHLLERTQDCLELHALFHLLERPHCLEVPDPVPDLLLLQHKVLSQIVVVSQPPDPVLYLLLRLKYHVFSQFVAVYWLPHQLSFPLFLLCLFPVQMFCWPS